MARLPLAQVLSVMLEKKDREKRLELWRHYMANVVKMLAEDGAKSFGEVLEDYDRAIKADPEADVRDGYEVARATLEALGA